MVALWMLAAHLPLAWSQSPSGARTSPRVLVVPIDGMIDLGLGPFVERALQRANDEGVALVVLEINTFGGRVDAAVLVRDHLLRSKVATVAFVNPRAISAGALISLAAETIVMAQGGTIGAATPVMLGAPGEAPKPTDEKSVSYVRKEFRATADARGRPGMIAEAMVDPDVEIDGLIEKDKLLTLTTDDAITHGIADHQAHDIEELLTLLGLADAEVEHVTENWAEAVLRFITNPTVASLLMSLGMLGLFLELRTPGFGIPGLIGVLCLVAFFWGHWIVHLVGWEQLALVAIGIALLAFEVFVLPGFGIAGVLGILAIGAGLSTSLFGSGASLRAVALAMSHVLISSAVAVLGSLLLLRFLPSLPGGKRLVLATELSRDVEVQGATSLVGQVGVTLTPLRPAGIANFDGHRVDVVSDGEFIEANQPIVVLRDEGTRVVVQTAPTPTPKDS
jgi:membrane-bound serine protease (ClpP class)